MKTKSSAELSATLERLTKLTEQVYETQGYSREVEKLTLLRELVKEQIHPGNEKNENISHSISSIR